MPVHASRSSAFNPARQSKLASTDIATISLLSWSELASYSARASLTTPIRSTAVVRCLAQPSAPLLLPVLLWTARVNKRLGATRPCECEKRLPLLVGTGQL
mmetsp:Transcript_16678/g.42863  ORF Transcript_16678/g.42863 Transcript_16678/m.42863 type:complete len:101 (+) Transcript_16678:109-411(+)